MSCSTALAAAFSFWMAESGDRLEPPGAEQPKGGHLSATPAHTKPPPPPLPLPLLGVMEEKGSRGSCLTEAAMEAGDPEAELPWWWWWCW